MHVFSPQGLFASRVLNLESQKNTKTHGVFLLLRNMIDFKSHFKEHLPPRKV